MCPLYPSKSKFHLTPYFYKSHSLCSFFLTATLNNMPKLPFIFDDVSRARLCDGTGSELSSDDSDNLSDLINSFIDGQGDDLLEDNNNHLKLEEISYQYTIHSLQKLLLTSSLHLVKRAICEETKRIIQLTNSPQLDKRRLMNELRERGFNAGVCRSEWEKSNQVPAGSYEYVDVIFDGKRYIVEVSLAGEFTIARPTNRYVSFLKLFPEVFVGRVEEMKEVVRVMCGEIKESMKANGMHVPPWRRNGYMDAKWFGSYKRITGGRRSGSVSCERIAREWRPDVFVGYCR